MLAFGVEIRGTRFSPGEGMILYSGNEEVGVIDLGSLPDAGDDTYFIGVLSDVPFDRVVFNEDPDNDDIAIADFRFATVSGNVSVYSHMGIYQNGWWYLDTDGTSGWSAGDTRIKFGIAVDIPVTGHWDADGDTDMGIFRSGWWYQDSNGTLGWNAGDTKINFGTAGDIPVSGMW